MYLHYILILDQKPFWIAAHFYETLSGWKWNYVAYCVRQYFHDMFKSFGFRWKENSIIHVIVNLCKNLTPYLPKYQKEEYYTILKRQNSKILLKMVKQYLYSFRFHTFKSILKYFSNRTINFDVIMKLKSRINLHLS